MVDFRSVLSWVFGLFLLAYGVVPILNDFGVGFQLPSFIMLLQIWILLGASIWLVIDGFMEQHFLKTITMIFALIMLVMVAVPMLNSAGWLPFGLPSFIYLIGKYVYAVSGILLLIGPIAYH